MAQIWDDIESTETLEDSRPQILQRDETLKSHFSGTSFPSTDLVVGMTCFRTDLNQLYELKAIGTPSTWKLIADLNKTYIAKEDADSFYAPLAHNHNGVYQPLDADLTAIAGLSSNGVIKRTGNGTMQAIASTSAGEAMLGAADAAAQRALLGLGALATKDAISTSDVTSGVFPNARLPSNAHGTRTVSTSSPSGGAVGDIWYVI